MCLLVLILALLCPGLVREPKHIDLKELHRAVKLCEQALVSVDPEITTLGTMQEVCLSWLFSAVNHVSYMG